MTSSPTPALAPALARLLAALSIVLLVVFLAAVLTTALPLKLLDPQWQLQFATTLISYATLPLVGALLLPLAVWVDPANHRFRARWTSFRRWALAAALGFLLLIPLQVHAGWTFHRTATRSQEQLVTRSGQKLAELRQAIGSAATPQELQVRLQQIFGPNAGLSPVELRTPMADLRQQLLARAEQASTALMQQIEAQAARKPDSLVKESLRIVLSTLAYAIGFAFLAGVLPRAQAGALPLRTVVDEGYFDELAQ